MAHLSRMCDSSTWVRRWILSLARSCMARRAPPPWSTPRSMRRQRRSWEGGTFLCQRRVMSCACTASSSIAAPSNSEVHSLESSKSCLLWCKKCLVKFCCRYWGEGRRSRESRPYDMWSVGITWLEIIFGTPHVFSISQRQRIMLHQALHLDRQQPVISVQGCLCRGDNIRTWRGVRGYLLAQFCPASKRSSHVNA